MITISPSQQLAEAVKSTLGAQLTQQQHAKQVAAELAAAAEAARQAPPAPVPPAAGISQG